jgi:hypothetical protein
VLLASGEQLETGVAGRTGTHWLPPLILRSGQSGTMGPVGRLIKLSNQYIGRAHARLRWIVDYDKLRKANVREGGMVAMLILEASRRSLIWARA